MPANETEPFAQSVRSPIWAGQLLGFLLLLTGCMKNPSTPVSKHGDSITDSKPTIPEIPRPATNERVELQIVDLEGYEKAIAGQLGHVVLVDFWATWCAPCRKQFPHTVELQRRLKGQGLTVISVSIDQLGAGENVEQLKTRVMAFLKDQQATFPNLLVPVTDLAAGDPGASDLVAARFDLDGGAIPHYKLYDRRGNLHRKFVVNLETGESFDPQEIDSAVEKLLMSNP